HLGEVYQGIISTVTSFGFFVELKDMFIHGVVRLVDVADDYYILEHDRHRLVGRRNRRVFQMGQPVTVRVASVNIFRRHINFEVADH
ncbi:MAG TPA: S1 RNA-binding domain-containing protein, partial [Thermodesulfobacteriaceae bacterium]|nr:S1 RNA-binding domain-containing protein [Thermodesulfobacteriaceae bacterium]